MSSTSCCGIWHRRHREDGSGQPTRHTDPETQCTTSVRPATVNERVRPQSARLISTSRSSASVPPTAYRTRNPNIIQPPVQNSPQQPTILATGESLIQPDLWGQAMDTLSDDEKTWIKHATGGASMSIPNAVDTMINLATKRQQQCEKSGWRTFHLNGHDISLGDLASNTIIWLNKFKEIGDIVVQYDPVHAALPWAVVRFLLQASITTKEQMAVFLTIMEKAARIIHRCQVFEGLYNRKTVDHVVVENLESALITLYASVLRGLVETNKFLSKSTPARSLYAVFHPTTGSGLLASLESGEVQVEREIVACEAQRKANTDARSQEQLRGLLELREPVLRTDENVKKVLEQLDREELIRILQWISPIEYRSHHNTVKELRTKDTCDWLLKRPKFGQWSSSTSTITLWLQGFPGSGKTYLTSRIIEEIEAVLIGKGSDESFALFYCNRNEENRRNALDILRSYVRQLSTTPHRSGFIHTQLKQLCIDSRLNGSGWTLGLCQQYLIELFNLYPGTILVLDALDECHPEERTSLLDFFDSIPSKTSKPVRIFISSRPEGDIRQRLVHLPSIEIQATDNEGDIAKYVRQSIERNGRWSDILKKNLALKNKIVNTLLTQSKGMFQWAALQINQLLNLRTEPEINSRLGKLPKGLKAAYDEIFKNIEDLNTFAGASSLRALRWIMCAYEPLTSRQLLAAVRVDPEEEHLESFEPTETDLLDWCANLVRIDSQQNPPVWRVSHLSVVEYLETHWTLLEAHCFVAKASLVLLLDTYGRKDEQESKPDDIFHPDHPLQKSVRYDWIRHVQTQEHRDVDPKLAALLKTFLGSLENSSVQYREWHNQTAPNGWMIKSLDGGYIDRRDIYPTTSTIFLVCRFSFYTLLRDWWDTVPVELLSQLADSGNDPLTLAAAAGCKPICIKLYEVGALVNMPLQIGEYGSALAAAAYRRNIEIVQFLVAKGADINMLLQTGKYGSALAAAASKENIKIVQFLVDKGANINMPLQTGYYGSALAAAVYEENIEIIQFLVSKRADINMPLQTGSYGSALAVAAYQRNITIVQFLVDKGADINMPLQTGSYGSALAVAAYKGNITIVQFLVDKGADINMPLQAGRYSSAFAAATCGGDIEIVQFLVDKGADINMLLQTGYYGSALAAATYQRNIEIVQFLVSKGVDINMPLQTGYYGSALAAAIYRENIEIVQFLVDNGADINMLLQTGIYGSALAAATATETGAPKIIQILIDNGADINMILRDSDGIETNALAIATERGAPKIIQILIDNGAVIQEPGTAAAPS